MAKKDEKAAQIRELPISLQGIETILIYLDEKNREASSIRNISKYTGLSMRVAKNILLQLEKFNQIERVVEKNNILPKWRITKFGKKVIKEAKGIEKKISFLSKEEELIHGIIIPENIEKLKNGYKAKQQLIFSKLNTTQIELSKMLGTVLNIDNPAFEDLISILIKRIKSIKQKVINLPSDLVASYKLKKMGEKEKKISKEEERLLFIEIFFLNSLILNEIKRIDELKSKLSQFLENEAVSNGFSVANDLREEIRTLSTLIYNRESINLNYHVFSKEDLKQLTKNKLNPDILDGIIDISMNADDQIKGIEEIILKFHSKINKGETQINNHSIEIMENIPLYTLYQLILDEKPDLNISIEQLEEVINYLADEGYIPGVKIIQGDEDHYLKVVQLKSHDITQDEIELISKAIKFQTFTLIDMIEATGWGTEQVIKILNNLTDLGILKYSKSFLHGERWYIVSEKSM